MTAPRGYRFGDSSRPGLVLGLGARQVIPLAVGVLWLAAALQLHTPGALVLAGPVAGAVVAFGRFRGVPLADVASPAASLGARLLRRRSTWVASPLFPPPGGDDTDLPRSLERLRLIEVDSDGHGAARHPIGVVVDDAAGTVTATLRVRGRGFPLASQGEQDLMVAAWGSALTPFARERCPVARVTWTEWTLPSGLDTHRAFMNETGVDTRDTDAAADYRALVEQQEPATVHHEVLVSITVDQRRVRRRRRDTSRLDAAIDALCDELRLFESRIDAAGLDVDRPMSRSELAATIRTRSDPTAARRIRTTAGSLAAAAGHRAIAWNPIAVRPTWSHVRVDGSLHRAYLVANWPLLPVAADWLGPLLGETRSTRTVCVVMEPVPMSRAARAADREVTAREADADMKARKGFRVNARERRRLADVEARERELSEGHAEFRFVGIVDVTAPDEDSLDDAGASVEQAAGQSLIELRPLEARHEQAWVATLPLGRTVAGQGTR